MMRLVLLILSLLLTPSVLAGDWQILAEDVVVPSGEARTHSLMSRRQMVNVGYSYQLEVRFSRESGSNSVAIFFPTAAGMVSLDIDGWGQGLTGLQQVNGQDMRQYSDRVQRIRLVNGQTYTARVESNEQQVSVFLNDKRLMQLSLQGQHLSLPQIWRVPATLGIGVGAWQSETRVHMARFRQLQSKAQNQQARSGLAISAVSKPVANDLAHLSDEFENPATFKNWQRVYQVEQTGADQLQRIDIGQSQPGWLRLMPYTSSWYQDWRGVLMFKPIEGDFVVTTKIQAMSRHGSGAPNSLYSLAGIMIRTPRSDMPGRWRAGNENYLFLSYGSANKPGSYQYEVKTTRNSDSKLEITNATSDGAEIRAARIDDVFILMNRINGQWRIHRRYHRSDMPPQLQVGMTVYTDWNGVEKLRPQQHNNTVIRGGNPDLIANFDYMRFQRPLIPMTLKEQNLMTVSDQALLAVLGFD